MGGASWTHPTTLRHWMGCGARGGGARLLGMSLGQGILPRLIGGGGGRCLPKGFPKAANGQSERVMSRTLPHRDAGSPRVSPDSCSLQSVPAPRSYPPGTRTRPRSYSQKRGNYSFATRTWLCSYSPMDEFKKLVLVRGRIRARCGFGHVRVREVPVAVAYPKSNSHLKPNSCVALGGPLPPYGHIRAPTRHTRQP